MEQGDLDEAQRQLALSRAAGESSSAERVSGLSVQADIALLRGEHAAALALHRERVRMASGLPQAVVAAAKLAHDLVARLQGDGVVAAEEEGAVLVGRDAHLDDLLAFDAASRALRAGDRMPLEALSAAGIWP